ncbi:tRNA pseudouridine(38-40) synthase TruA [Candidatus Cyanaurora vandensis]|uniref:tRNA pseudouridine(38-40) synthase TruA n=1 Tax=Candidatus Cyanaurora vandensis TaxID=2714958 RepID=UPI00257CFC1A|nr:tRNA pseudouridine(38-40) synthase TruA [Candidatus Cyanaurora vandensis]
MTGRRIALWVQYWGRDFYGFQRQEKNRTIQGVLEDTLSGIVGHPVTLHGAGRTDRGVHARGQVVHFDTPSPIPPANWPVVINSRLPSDLLVREAVLVYPPWHARFSALWREYCYTIHNSDWRDLFWQDRSWFYYKTTLDTELIQQALMSLLGSHDLRALQLTGSERVHSLVRVDRVSCNRVGELVYIRVRALSFLYGMMRLLVGLLVRVGAGELTVADFIHIWQAGLREKVTLLAPPEGLSLVAVGYPRRLFASGFHKTEDVKLTVD